jgi:SAM-dependent methyltransferase
LTLTDKNFWNNYWANVKLPSVVDKNHSFDRCLSKELEQVTSNLMGEIFEIGCAPGKWIGFLSLTNKLIPSGIEYSPIGVELTLKNLDMLKIKSGEIINGDFFAIEPHKNFDIVMSLGFIEHFDNPEEVIAQHLKWLKPGGTLIIGVPNFAGITKLIQSQLDKSLLDKHNLNTMDIDFFKEIGSKFKLSIRSIKYLGSFEPDLPIPVKRFGNPIQIILKLFLIIMRIIRKKDFIDNFNNRFFSSYMLAVYEK